MSHSKGRQMERQGRVGCKDQVKQLQNLSTCTCTTTTVTLHIHTTLHCKKSRQKIRDYSYEKYKPSSRFHGSYICIHVCYWLWATSLSSDQTGPVTKYFMLVNVLRLQHLHHNSHLQAYRINQMHHQAELSYNQHKNCT